MQRPMLLAAKYKKKVWSGSFIWERLWNARIK